MQSFLRIAFLLSLVVSCAQRKDHAPVLQSSFTGYNRFGEPKTCYVVSESSCQSTSADAEKFRDACKAQKGVFGQCDCNSFLCSVELVGFKPDGSLSTTDTATTVPTN